jgi:hypothetical protein
MRYDYEETETMDGTGRREGRGGTCSVGRVRSALLATVIGLVRTSRILRTRSGCASFGAMRTA